MTQLTYNELLENYKLLIGLVMDLKAEKEAYIEASRDSYEHPSGVAKNFDSTSFASQYSESRLKKAQKLLDIQREIDRKIAQIDKRISEMLETKKQIDYLLGLPTERN